MAKRKSGTSKRNSSPNEKTADDKKSSILDQIDAMSSDEDSPESAAPSEWSKEAVALRQIIADGAFNHLLKESKSKSPKESEAFKEASVDDVSVDDASEDAEDQSDADEESDGESDTVSGLEGKALLKATNELISQREEMPWVETFEVIPKQELSFGQGGKKQDLLGVHDDLKRELAFYNLALEAAGQARRQCKAADVPFTRPEDFFVEMIKTDGKSIFCMRADIVRRLTKVCCTDQMAKIKDRLIFEGKKIDAVTQRKANKEQRLRAKEAQANKLAEKSKRRKDHLAGVEAWAKTAASGRGRALPEDDDYHLNNVGKSSSKKRMAADRKYGFGGKRGRFKQNDSKSKNDMSGFNPRGNFGGMGSKSKGNAGSKRKGKRARDAARLKR